MVHQLSQMVETKRIYSLLKNQLAVKIKLTICMTHYCVGCRKALIPPDLHCIG